MSRGVGLGGHAWPVTLEGDLDDPGLAGDPSVAAAVEAVDAGYVETVLERVCRPRSWDGEPDANREVAEWIRSELGRLGLATEIRAPHANVLGHRATACPPRVLICAHYDSVPGSPGADDNGSGVAALLASAAVLAPRVETAAWIAFNAEEAGLRGSREFVASALPALGWRPEVVHVLEMVGFTASGPGSQKGPPELPVRLPSVGDFIGVVADGRSGALAQEVRRVCARYLPSLRTQTLTIRRGFERHFRDLLRSDHVPFWEAGVPALMWTDTAEFRNPNYHARTDERDTLDVGLIRSVAQALVAHVLSHRREPGEA